MPAPPAIFHSEAAFRGQFAEGLVRLLAEPSLGSYILALANAHFDPAIQSAPGTALEQVFARQFEVLERARDNGTLPELPPDDLEVFDKLRDMGLAALPEVGYRRVGPWELQFNALRALRPPRAAGDRVDTLYQPFNPRGFQFNKPFLRKETLWAGELHGKTVDLLYNKFPFIPAHGLLVPERERELPQWLEPEHHAWLWELGERFGSRLPGLGFGYNARGAHASVNHLHFQFFIRQAPLPVESAHWQHNGGPTPYPLACQCFSDPDSARDFLAHLHARNHAYNLLYRPGRLYCLPRLMQGHYHRADWNAGFAWHEVCGGILLFQAQAFAGLSEADIAEELAALNSKL